MLGLGGLGGYLPGQVPGGVSSFSNAARSAARGGGMEPVTAALLSTGISVRVFRMLWILAVIFTIWPEARPKSI